MVVDGGPPSTVSTTSAPVQVSPGRHAFAVTAVDAAGNTSPTANSGPVRFDPSAPVAPVLTSPGSGGYLRSRTATVTWVAGTDDDSGIVSQTVLVNGRKAAVVAADATSANVTLAERADVITVKAVNGAGLATMSDPVSVTVDSIASRRSTGRVRPT